MKKTKPSEEERKKKKKPMKTKPMRKKKKKKISWSKGAAEWVPHMCLITKMSLSYELWKLKLFSVSITYNSKIRELSDVNKKLETELWLAKPTFF